MNISSPTSYAVPSCEELSLIAEFQYALERQAFFSVYQEDAKYSSFIPPHLHFSYPESHSHFRYAPSYIRVLPGCVAEVYNFGKSMYKFQIDPALNLQLGSLSHVEFEALKKSDNPFVARYVSSRSAFYENTKFEHARTPLQSYLDSLSCEALL